MFCHSLHKMYITCRTETESPWNPGSRTWLYNKWFIPTQLIHTVAVNWLAWFGHCNNKWFIPTQLIHTVAVNWLAWFGHCNAAHYWSLFPFQGIIYFTNQSCMFCTYWECHTIFAFRSSGKLIEGKLRGSTWNSIKVLSHYNELKERMWTNYRSLNTHNFPNKKIRTGLNKHTGLFQFYALDSFKLSWQSQSLPDICWHGNN